VTKIREDKNIKKTLNIVFVIVSLVVLTLATVYFVFQTSYFQRIIINKLTSSISQSIDAEVSIGSVDIALFRKLVLNEVYISDQHKDTLLYTQKLIAGFDSVSLKNKDIHFKSISLVNPKVYVERDKDQNYNFEFLFNSDSVKTIQNKWNFHCSRLELKNGEFIYSDPNFADEFKKLLKIKKIDLILDDLKFKNVADFAFNIKKMKLTSKLGFELKGFTSSIYYKDSTLNISQLNGFTDYSQLIIDTLSFNLKKYYQSKNTYDIVIDLLINQLNIDYKDISRLFPDYFCEGLNIGMSGRIYGKINEIKGKEVKANLGEITRINGDFYLNGLPDIENTYIFINLHESYANLLELRNLNLPAKLQFIKTSLPKFLQNVGTFSYKGNFTGFTNDFVAYGTAYSNLGIIESDVSFKPSENNVLKLNGHIKTHNLNVGSIFQTKHVDKLTLNGELDGYVANSFYNLTFNGLVDTIYINNYCFQKINIKGNLKNKHFDGSLSVNDPNLKMNYFGSLDLSPVLPVFEFVANVKYANLFRLNLSDDKISKIAFSVDANFEGNNVDNLVGRLEIDSLCYRNSIDSLTLRKAVLSNSTSGETSVFSLKSDWIDAEMEGRYSFMNITSSLMNFYKHYLPSSTQGQPIVESGENNFNFRFLVKTPDPLTIVFIPGLFLQPPFQISGSYNATDQTARLETSIHYLRYFSREADDLTLKFKADIDAMECQVISKNIHLANKINMCNLVVESIGKDDRLDVGIRWDNDDAIKYSGTINTTTRFEKSGTKYPHVLLNIEPSQIYIADSLWNIDQTTINIDSTAIEFHNFTFHKKNQRLNIDGKVCEDDESKVTATIADVDFAIFEPLMGQSDFKGILNGQIDIANIYKKQKLNLNLSLNNFSFKNALIGDFEIKSNWKSEIEKLETQIKLSDHDQIVLNGNGLVDPVNSIIDMNVFLDRTPISILEVFVPFLFYDTNGNLNGKVHLTGPLSDMAFNGELKPVTRVGIGIKPIKTHYFFNESVYFKDNLILFPSVKFVDEFDNKGLLKGSIEHHDFLKMKFDLTVLSDKILAMNTTSSDNEDFYGTAYGSGIFTVSGKGDEVLLKGDIRSEKGTNIYIPFEGKEDVTRYDFIQFTSTNIQKNQPTIPYRPVSNGLNMNFDIELTPDAKAQLIFNSQIGDIIKGEGNGNLQVKIDNDFKIKLYGDYVIEKGEYLFTLENIINKKFLINRGGTIKWTGDPYDAQVDITAVYKLKTTLSELNPGNTNDVKRRWPVDCIVKLSESLLKPSIDFQIELPTADDQKKDEFNRLISTKEEINKQMVSLLMLGRFYTPDFFTGKPTTETGTQLMGTTVSEAFSNQLSNMLSQIFDKWDFGVNYRPGNEITNDQVELALSTQILDDRITFDGNVANNSDPATKSGELVGDFDMKVKLTNDGRLLFKAFSHSNDNSNYDTAPTTQGIGFTYREEFNTLRELFQQYKNAILKKKKHKTSKEDIKIQPQ
jgi:hypothetical protein